ncbi:MAG: hypothetical protein ACTHMD_01375 [Flavisolibacter sp.]
MIHIHIELLIESKDADSIPVGLQQAIESCKSIEELDALVYATADKTEAMDVAFTKRSNELESSNNPSQIF